MENNVLLGLICKFIRYFTRKLWFLNFDPKHLNTKKQLSSSIDKNRKKSIVSEK